MIIDDGGAACVMASPRSRRPWRREGGWPHRHPGALSGRTEGRGGKPYLASAHAQMQASLRDRDLV